MFDSFSDHSKRLMVQARLAATRLGHDAIAPEHVLFGILDTRDCRAATVLTSLGVDLDALRASLLAGCTPGAAKEAAGQMPFLPTSKRVLELTMEEAVRAQHATLGSEHLLLGILGEGHSLACSVLTQAGVTLDQVRRAVVAARRLLLISNSTAHGGGYLEHCVDELRAFLGAERQRVLFVPYALADHAGYAAKARTAFADLGHDLTSVHTHADPAAAVEVADAVFIGGGNTFRLLQALYSTNLLGAIARRARSGMPYIGSSAGTNVATPSIRTTNDMPIVVPPSFAALELVPFQINPHYLDPDPQSRHMGETREERLRQFHEENTAPVLALREGCMLRVEGSRMELRGTTGARLFRRDAAPQEFTPPCDLSFLL